MRDEHGLDDLVEGAFLFDNTFHAGGERRNQAVSQKNPHEGADERGADHLAQHFRRLGDRAHGLDDPEHGGDDAERRKGVGHALQSLADALPALGIVAAVLGVIKTMGSITEPPEVLGAMIGGALVGTFMGVFLAYGLVGPMASRMKAIVDEESAFYRIIQSVLVAHLHGNAAQISVEIGRGDIPSAAQPSFLEMEEALNAMPNDAA